MHRRAGVIVINTPKFFAQLDVLRAKFKPAQWASYFAYKLVSSAAFSLGGSFDDEDFELQKLLTGVTARPERFKRCITETSTALGELLGQQYIAAYFPGSSKQVALQLVDAVFAGMGDSIGTADWISGPTKTAAAAKLAKLVHWVGYPDAWRTYDFAVKRDDFAGNELRSWAFENHRILARAGTPVDRTEWNMNAFTVNAYFSARQNNTALPAGILQPPLFGAHRSMTVNLGSIGWVIGHELTHGFDDQGAQYDAAGNRRSWWQPEDATKFDAKATCVAEQYYDKLRGASRASSSMDGSRSSRTSRISAASRSRITRTGTCARAPRHKSPTASPRTSSSSSQSVRATARRTDPKRSSVCSRSMATRRRSCASPARCATCTSSPWMRFTARLEPHAPRQYLRRLVNAASRILLVKAVLFSRRSTFRIALPSTILQRRKCQRTKMSGDVADIAAAVRR